MKSNVTLYLKEKQGDREVYWYKGTFIRINTVARTALYLLGDKAQVCNISHLSVTLLSLITFNNFGILSRMNSSTRTPSFRYLSSTGCSFASFVACFTD